jgi:RNA polymerase sigma factor (sigma-70 family)
MAEAQLRAVLWHVRGLVATPGTTGQSDGTLLRAFTGANDQAAFAALVKRHGPMVLNLCRRLLRQEQDAEDAFQATFLLLARGSESLGGQPSLAGWLHGVAYRMASNARRMAGRRRRHEGRAAAMHAAGPEWEVMWREVQSILDEELEHLPDIYREAFVLSCLENRKGADVARTLGVKEGTVRSRLAKARTLLQRALTRRGVSLPALLAAGFVVPTAQVGVPASLFRSTLRAATLAATGNSAAPGAVSANVAALLQGATRTMTTMKTATVLLLTLAAFATGIGALAYQEATVTATGAPRAPVSQPPAKEPVKVPAPDGKEVEALEINGRVVNPAGQPVEGAKLYLIDDMRMKTTLAPLTTSGADGRFHFTVPAGQVALSTLLSNRWDHVHVLATAKGFGPALEAVHDPAATGERTLRLAADDLPIKGRVLDLEGKPVVGAKVRVEHLSAPRKGDLTAWLEDLKASKDGVPSEHRNLASAYGRPIAALFPEVTTDTAGRFQLKGVGRERVVGLNISGPAIETRRVRVYTCPGETIRCARHKEDVELSTLTYYGASFDHLAGPTRPVVGVVRDKDTGKPLAGATVQPLQNAIEVMCGWCESLHTLTDKEGRYRLIGLPKSDA